jgi:hypothetical protein
MRFGTLLTCHLMAICVLQFAGCEKPPPQGTVHGTVTLNGEPVDGGLIRMVPVEGDAQSADTVVTQGKYELTLPLGKKKVELTWSKDSGAPPDTASQGTVPPPKELFPPKYNSQTTLEYEVTPGRVEKNWDLKHP